MQDILDDKDRFAQDKALLVAIYEDNAQEDHCQEMLDELDELVQTNGGNVVGRMAVKIREPKARYLVGSGKADEIVASCREHDANMIIFDEILSPAQQRNWEKLARLQVIDRQELILSIFAQRASTREAELQIELARSEYLLPRLKNAWTHLHRQRGGVAVRGGEGEKQIELDGRMLRKNITKLKKELVTVRKQRAEQRKRRQRVPVPGAAIVGYTNAGKSMLLKRLTQAKILVEDKLFATLDPTTRKIKLPTNQDLLLTDTVGFVRKLPHNLVEAFKATLEEAVTADFLVHVVDMNSPSIDEHINTTLEVLKDIGAGDQEKLLVFNKVDVSEAYLHRRLKYQYPDAIFISAKTGQGMDEFLERLAELRPGSLQDCSLHLPSDKYDILALLHREGQVHDERYEDDGIYVNASIPGKYKRELEPFLQ